MKRLQPAQYFTSRLLAWNEAHNRRQMPWKGERDPYKIWLSEIILQQTRVEQGTEYYNRFVKTYPTVRDLAEAPDDQVFKLWEGLGYYSRCRNLLKAARFINQEQGGRFPDTPGAILALPGVGPYTAAAIGSFAFDLPLAVVDGNVFRVLARFFGIHTPTDSTAGKKEFTALAGKLLDLRQPAAYNQALMDFGATVCKPQRPLCDGCPLRAKCQALAAGAVNTLPVKSKMMQRKNRWFYYLVAGYQGGWYVRKREAKDIWQHLYEFIGVEGESPLDPDKALQTAGFPAIRPAQLKGSPVLSGIYKQQLTHQTIYGQFIRVELRSPLKKTDAEWVDTNRFRSLPFPKLITAYLQDKTVSLNL